MKISFVVVDLDFSPYFTLNCSISKIITLNLDLEGERNKFKFFEISTTYNIISPVVTFIFGNSAS